MDTIKRVFSALSATMILLGIIFGLVIGYFIFRERDDDTKEIIDSRVVVERVTEEGFLVTSTIYLDQTAQINIDQGSAWSNFFWGKEITAEAPVRVDMGVDLTELEEDDVIIDEDNQEICLLIPSAEINTISIDGEINAEVKDGVFRAILKSEANEDYNLAVETLKSEAQASIELKEDLYVNAERQALEMIEFLFSETGYTVSCN